MYKKLWQEICLSVTRLRRSRFITLQKKLAPDPLRGSGQIDVSILTQLFSFFEKLPVWKMYFYIARQPVRNNMKKVWKKKQSSKCEWLHSGWVRCSARCPIPLGPLLHSKDTVLWVCSGLWAQVTRTVFCTSPLSWAATWRRRRIILPADRPSKGPRLV